MNFNLFLLLLSVIVSGILAIAPPPDWPPLSPNAPVFKPEKLARHYSELDVKLDDIVAAPTAIYQQTDPITMDIGNQIPAVPLPLDTSSVITMAGWVKFTSLHKQYIFLATDSYTGHALMMHPNGQLQYYEYDYDASAGFQYGASFLSTVSLAAKSYVHLAIVKSRTMVALYINGVRDGAIKFADLRIATSAPNLYIGCTDSQCETDNSCFEGEMSGINFYGGDLIPTEVYRLYSNTKPASIKGF